MVERKPPLIIGIGNPILTDDSIGPRLVDFLSSLPDFSFAEFRKESLGGLDILEMIQGYERVIFIDAIRTKGGIPGDVYLFSLDDFKETLHLSNLHDVSFLTAIELGKKLGLSVPGNISIVAVEILEDLVFSDRLSLPLEARFLEIKKETETIIRKLLASFWGHVTKPK